MAEDKIEIGNKVEGPILQRTVELPISEWKDRLNPRKTDDDTIPFDKNKGNINPFRKELIHQLSEQLGELAGEDPIYLALTHPNSPDYVYRCFGRTVSEPDPTINIHTTGYDKLFSAENTKDDSFWYGIGKAWFLKLWPNTDNHKSYILIYRNDNKTFPQDGKLFDPKLLKTGASSLRDLLIGIVKIDWK